jgi:two-component system cell cycle sensor histidine kinase/response regulator CckA
LNRQDRGISVISCLMADLPSGKLETILVVDDDESIRAQVTSILQRANYRVLSSDNGAAAIKLSQETSERIDLLLSDVDLRQISGPDLGETLKKTRPDMHVMLMSGGSDGNGNLLVLNYGWAYIQKTLVAAKLVEMVKDVLCTPNRSQAGGQQFDTRKDVDHKG